MKLNLLPGIMIICITFFNHACHSQEKGAGDGTQDRHPAVAGQFYAIDSVELQRNVEELFAGAVARKADSCLRAIIVPHAGYAFSGQVAASGFNQIDPAKKYKRIFIIGSSHTMHFDGASVYAEGNFVTPLGKVPVDTATARELLKNDAFLFSKEAHRDEHSLEVQLPFLQFHMNNEFSIIPIIIGGNSLKQVSKIADALKPYYNDENLFVISADFSHYPKYKDAVENDKRTLDAIMQNSPDQLALVVGENASKHISDLATSLCAYTSVMALLYFTSEDTTAHPVHIQYMNSGDSPYGDTIRVVGYNAIAFYSSGQKEEQGFQIGEEDKNTLLDVARKTIQSYVSDHKTEDFADHTFSDALNTYCGAFVTLHKGGKLRGCIGRFTADIPLYLVVRDMAIASATQDYRFSPVSESEIDAIEIEISVLSPMQKISSIDEIVLGKHGIYITKDGRSGTFLPQVATETGWTKEEFLGHCAQDKAGIGWDGWKTGEVYVYTAVVFGE